MNSDVNATYPTYKDTPDAFDNAVDITYSSNSIERNNNHLNSNMATKTTLRPFITTNTKFPKFWIFEEKHPIFILSINIK